MNRTKLITTNQFETYLNTKDEGIKILNSVGTTDYANGGVINPEETLVDSNEVRNL